MIDRSLIAMVAASALAGGFCGNAALSCVRNDRARALGDDAHFKTWAPPIGSAWVGPAFGEVYVEGFSTWTRRRREVYCVVTDRQAREYFSEAEWAAWVQHATRVER